MKLKVVFLLFFFYFSSNQHLAYGNISPESHWADSVYQQMNLDEKIGQLFMIAAYSNQGENYENELEKQIRKYHVGGLIFFQGDAARQLQLTLRYQKASKYPLMIGMDAEHGVGWRLKNAMEFPVMLINGAVQNDSLIFALGATIARHCQTMGVHVNFAPVVDVNSNPANPIIGMRSFGESPEEVAPKAILYLKGTESQGVLAVAKHFPGHGDTDTDSHQALPSISHSRSRLDSIELYPYRALMEAGLPAIMTSHLNVKALDPTDCPASLSPVIIRNFLKKELGFQGLCFTDAMNMKGVVSVTPAGEAEVKALAAGNDVLLFPSDLTEAVKAIKKALNDSIISEEILSKACKKILMAKYRYVLPHLLPSDTPGLWSRLNSPADIALKQNLYREAITLIRNEQDFLPLKRLDTLKIASVNFGSKEINNFQTTLSKYTDVSPYTCAKQLDQEDLLSWQKKLKNYNCIIIYNNTANNVVSKDFGHAASLASLLRVLSDKKIILCHPAIPYGLNKYPIGTLSAVLLSYDKHLYAQQYAAQAIFGGIGINGRLPVGIDSIFPAGTGIPTPKTRLGYSTPEMCGFSSEALTRIDSICQEAIRIQATPGCQVLIAKEGHIFYNKAFGYHTYKKEKANTTNDIYDIASVTKITATLPAIMKLYDERAINLTAPLSLYYPALDTTNKKDLTIQEILCHNAGLKTSLSLFTDAIDKKSLSGPLFTTRRTPNNTLRLKDHLYMNVKYQFRDSTFSNVPKTGYKKLTAGLYLFPGYQDTILRTILSSPLNAQKKYAYSDLGFILLKFAVENISGKTLSRYCKDTFYRQLGMNSTDFKAGERLNKSRIIPSSVDKLYRKTEIHGTVHDPTAALLGGIAGHAGLFSTAEDLAKILQMYLNKGTYGGEYYFSPETVATFTEKNNLFPANRRGLGFDKPEPDTTKISPVYRYTPLSSFGHTGFTGIMTWCDPDNNLIYIFMSNRTYPDEFNTKLSEQNIRTKIQKIIYKEMEKWKD